MVKVEKRLRKDEKPLVCYNCGGRGHTSRPCPSEAFFCDTRGTRKSDEYRGRTPEVRRIFCMWECQKLWYDQKAREREFKTGEEVLVLLPTTSSKLLAQWQWPYCVLHRVGEVNYEVHVPDKRKRKTIFHVNMLKRWHQPEVTCMWAAEVDSGEEEDVPSWR